MPVSSKPVRRESIVISRDHEVFLLLHLRGSRLKFRPVRQFLLDRVGIICSKYILCYRSAVYADSGRGLPCHRFEYAHICRRHLLRERKLIFQFLVRKSHFLSDVQGIVAVDVNSKVFFGRQIKIYSLIRAEILCCEKLLREQFHVLAFFLRQDPVHCDVSDPSFPVPDILIAGIVHDKQGFQGLVPAVNIEVLALTHSAQFFYRKLFGGFLLISRLGCPCDACRCRFP